MATDFCEPDYEDIDSRIDELRGEGKDHEARDLVRKALETAPEDSDLLIRLGGIYFGMNNIPQASKVLRKARRLGDSDAEIDYLLGECELLSDNLSEAKKHYDQYLKSLLGLGETYPIDKIDQNRISEIAMSFYAHKKYIESLKFFRFIFTHGPLWVEPKEYHHAAESLHKCGGARFREEKYGYIEQAIIFSQVRTKNYQRRHALMLYDDSNAEEDHEKQQEMADKAIRLFEYAGIKEITNIGTLNKLKFLYKHYRDWDDRTIEKIGQCNSKIEEIRKSRIKKSKCCKGRKAKFKRVARQNKKR